jgi:hypothetical protein
MLWLRPNHKLKGIPYCLSATAYSICSLYMGGRSSIRNLRTRHAIVTGTPLLLSFQYVRSYKYNIIGQMYTLIWHHKMAQLCSLRYVTKGKLQLVRWKIFSLLPNGFWMIWAAGCAVPPDSLLVLPASYRELDTWVLCLRNELVIQCVSLYICAEADGL